MMKGEKAVVKIPFFPYNIHVMVFWDFSRKYALGKSAGTSDHALSTEMPRGKNGYTGKVRSI